MRSIWRVMTEKQEEAPLFRIESFSWTLTILAG
jgi:hypothetical protein